MTNVIPPAALTQHIAILAKTGAGKSYAARGIVEGILDGNGRVCVIDPTGIWYGLRSSATGKSAGYPVVIFGGEHADLPLSGAHGEAIAEIIGTSSTPAIIDTSQLRTKDRTRFFTDFADALMRKNRGPLHVIIDEAHVFLPQGKVPDPQSGAMLHAANNLVSGGRARGLRVMLISQRPAKLHKDSLSQVETLVVMRLIAPQDRAAVEEWIKDNADTAKGKEIISSLATLKTGQGWIWAPELGVLERVAFPRISTFDSMKAPEHAGDGKGQVLAPIDREAIAQRLQSVQADALANDPATLKQQIAKLQKEVQTAQRAQPAPVADEKTLERARAAGWEECRKEITSLIGLKAAEAAATLRDAAKDLTASADALLRDLPAPKQLDRPVSYTAHPQNVKRSPATERAIGEMARKASAAHSRPGSDEVGTGGKRRILIALAQYPDGMPQRKLSILVDISPKGGTWRTYMADMRSRGWVEGGSKDTIRITDAGLEALGSYEPLPTGEALIQYWRQRLGESGKRAIFDVVVAAYPDAVDVDEVAQETGIARQGGTWRTYMAELRGLGLIEGRDELRASEDLYS